MKNFDKSLTIDAIEIVEVIGIAMKRFCCLFMCLLLSGYWMTNPVYSQTISEEKNQRILTHVVRVKVSEQSEQAERAALRQAFRQVVLKMSGERSSVTPAILRRLQPNAASLLKAYQYEIDESQIYYLATFDQVRLQELLLQNNLPIWDQRRPQSMLWLQVNEPQSDESVLLSEAMSSFSQPGVLSNATALLDQILQISEQRGLELDVPIYDIEDASLVSYYDVWGRFMNPIADASERYGIDHFIAARIRRSSTYDEEALKHRLKQLESLALLAKAESLALFDRTGIPTDGGNEQPVIDELDRVLQALSKQTEALSEDDTRQFELGQLNFEQTDAAEESLTNSNSAQRDNPQILFDYDEFTSLLAPLQPLQLEYSFQAANHFESGVVGGTEQSELVSELIHRYADMLSRLYAIESVNNADVPLLTITVNNVSSIGDYAQIMDLLSGLSVVEFVSLERIQANQAVFALRLLSEQQRLVEALLLDGRLMPKQDEFGNALEEAEFYWGTTR